MEEKQTDSNHSLQIRLILWNKELSQFAVLNHTVDYEVLLSFDKFAMALDKI